MRGVLCLAAAALLVAGCAAPTAPAATTALPPSSASAATYGVSVANGLTVPVTVYVGGEEIGTVSPGATQDWAPATLPAKPWSVEARSASGRVLASMTVSASDYISSTFGKATSADLACGRLQLWSGPPTTGGPTFIADPSKPCDDAGSAAAALSVVDRYEAARARGDVATAWSLLASQSQQMFPTVQDFGDMLRKGVASDGSAYALGEARTDDPTIAAWLAKSAPGTSDPGRVFSIEVTHPNATTEAGRVEAFYVALDMSGAWRLWFN